MKEHLILNIQNEPVNGLILDLSKEILIKGYQQKMNRARRNRKARLQNILEYKNQEEREK